MRKSKLNEETLLEETNLFISQILNVPGDKIVTITNEEGSIVFDIAENGKIGYSPVHPAQFANQIYSCLSFGGSLILRQFTKETTAVKSNGRIIKIPYKNLYGARFKNGYWEWISDEEMRIAHCTDSVTGQPLPAEEAVNYCSFKF